MIHVYRHKISSVVYDSERVVAREREASFALERTLGHMPTKYFALDIAHLRKKKDSRTLARAATALEIEKVMGAAMRRLESDATFSETRPFRFALGLTSARQCV